MLELGEIDGPIPINVGLFQDLGDSARQTEDQPSPRLRATPAGPRLLTLSMSCFISEALSRVSSPSPVRQFTSWLRSSLFRVPSSSKSRQQTQEAQKDVVRVSSMAPGGRPAPEQYRQEDHRVPSSSRSLPKMRKA